MKLHFQSAAAVAPTSCATADSVGRPALPKTPPTRSPASSLAPVEPSPRSTPSRRALVARSLPPTAETARLAAAASEAARVLVCALFYCFRFVCLSLFSLTNIAACFVPVGRSGSANRRRHSRHSARQHDRCRTKRREPDERGRVERAVDETCCSLRGRQKKISFSLNV